MEIERLTYNDTDQCVFSKHAMVHKDIFSYVGPRLSKQLNLQILFQYYFSGVTASIIKD